MSCCGSQRQAYAAALSQRRVKRVSAVVSTAPATTVASVATSADGGRFQYRGSSALKLQNPANGHRYVFATPGAIVLADAADTTWLASFPWLQQIR